MGCTQSQHKLTMNDSLANNRNKKTHLELPKQYDVNAYTTCLIQALTEGDAVCLLRALLNCGDSQRHDVMRNYSDRRGQSLLEEIVSSAVKHHWRSWVVFTAELLLLTKPESTVKYVKRLLSDDHLSEVTLARVLCCQSDEDVQALLHSYREITGESLVDEINDKCTAESAEALSAFLSEKQDVEINPADYANNLVQMTSANKLFEENKLFFSYLKTLPSNKLKDVFEMFLKQCQRDLTVEIEKHYRPGLVQDTLKTIVGIIRNAPLERVSRIHELLSSTEADQQAEELCYLILSPALGQLAEVKQLYKTTHFETLAKDVQDLVTDDSLKRVLLHAVK